MDEQGYCPEGHLCWLDEAAGVRRCAFGYWGAPLGQLGEISAPAGQHTTLEDRLALDVRDEDRPTAYVVVGVIRDCGLTGPYRTRAEAEVELVREDKDFGCGPHRVQPVYGGYYAKEMK